VTRRISSQTTAPSTGFGEPAMKLSTSTSVAFVFGS
jgi:hypothetical protein